MSGAHEKGLAQNRRREELLKVAEQAAAWLIDLEEGRPEVRTAFAAWLEESPLHVEMFLRASSVDRLTELMAPEDVRALSGKTWDDEGSVIDWAVKRYAPASFTAHLAPIHGMPEGRPPSFSRRAPFLGMRRALVGIAAGVLALVAGGAWYQLLGPGAWNSYGTQIGEQRIVQLRDGSVVYVNTDSSIEVRYTNVAREVRLRDGEALFKVERDPNRPFRVHVADTVVQAVGTQFNIYRRSNETKVAVVEGVVQVSSRRGAPPIAAPVAAAGSDAEGTEARLSRGTERLAAGQGLSLSEDGSLETPVPVNVEQVTAWRERRLVFEWQTLEEITAEFNRYNRTPQIRVEGDEVRQRRYTAVFDADSPQTLLRFLAKDADLKFAADGDDFVIRAR